MKGYYLARREGKRMGRGGDGKVRDRKEKEGNEGKIKEMGRKKGKELKRQKIRKDLRAKIYVNSKK